MESVSILASTVAAAEPSANEGLPRVSRSSSPRRTTRGENQGSQLRARKTSRLETTFGDQTLPVDLAVSRIDFARLKNEAAESVKERRTAIGFDAVQQWRAVCDEHGRTGIDGVSGEGALPVGRLSDVFFPKMIVQIGDDDLGLFFGTTDRLGHARDIVRV